MSNPFFKNTFNKNNNEAQIYVGASNEIIEMHGIDMYYLSRTIVDLDNIFGEDTRSKFTENRIVTFLIENYQNYDGVGEIFSKFGFTPDHQLTLKVERQNFISIVGKEPFEGDLIYHPAGDKFFEIVHVNDKDEFYQFNHDEYTYRLQCKLFEYSHEDIETSVEEIDSINQEDQDTSEEADQFETEETTFLDLDEADVFGNL